MAEYFFFDIKLRLRTWDKQCTESVGMVSANLKLKKSYFDNLFLSTRITVQQPKIPSTSIHYPTALSTNIYILITSWLAYSGKHNCKVAKQITASFCKDKVGGLLCTYILFSAQTCNTHAVEYVGRLYAVYPKKKRKPEWCPQVHE